MRKITEERFNKIWNTLETKTLVSTARIHKISERTASRINRSGGTFRGYLHLLCDERPVKLDYITPPPAEIHNNPSRGKGVIRTFLDNLGKSLWDESEKL